jgi:ParB family transcriptional regulator, chromosome partitioning protein
MADDATRSRLGRGLAALIGDVGQEPQTGERTRAQRRVPIEFVQPNPRNPRKQFSESDLEDLTASIRERGLIQPVVVRSRGPDSYEIIAGERRWRSAQRAGLHELPIVVLDVTDAEALELAIVENVQRADLNPVEEATGYQSLIDEFKHSQEDLARIVGKSRSHIANTLRLLKLPESVKAYLKAGKLTAGHARALLGQPEPERLAREIVEKGLNVRQVEALAQESATRTAPRKPRASASKDPDTIALEQRVSDALGLVVSVDHRGEGGVLHIRYRDLDQLDDVLRRLERTK